MFKITEAILKVSKNILSCETVLIYEKETEKIVSHIELIPDKNASERELIDEIRKQCQRNFPEEILSKQYYRIIPMGSTYELTKSGKRNIRALELKQTKDCNKLY